MRRLLLLLSVCLASGAPALGALKGPAVHGHRGCRAVMPENTLAAFDEALRLGVDVIETDMQVTKDDVLVISHDQSVSPEICLGPDGRRLAGPVAIRSLTSAELRRYDCGSLPNPRFPRQQARPGERIPTLDEVFGLVQGSEHPGAKAVQFNMETKIVPGKPGMSAEPERFAALVAEAVRGHGLEARVIVQSFDQRTLLALKKLAPKIRTSLLTSDNYLDFAAAARSAKADFVSPDQDWILPEDVKALHRRGVKVAPWTVNEPKGWQRMLDLGVDAVITDDPEGFIAFLKAKGLR
jgi:glycerophosphoryl diester phosphodiesterase